MSVKVTLRKREGVPEDFVYSVLMSTLKMSKEEYERIKKADGSVSLIVFDPDALARLRNIAEKYGELVDITFESVSSEDLFSLSVRAVRSNLGLAFSWCVTVLVLGILSLIPVLGMFISLLLNVFIYSFLLYVCTELLDGKEVGDTFQRLSFGKTFSFIKAGLGFWLGSFFLGLVLTLLGVLMLISLGFTGGFLGSFAGAKPYDGFFTSGVVAFILFLLILLWVIYLYPLITSRALRRGEPDFVSSFLAPLSVLTPSAIKEGFSKEYLSIGGMWSLASTAGFIGFVLTSALILTIPLSLLILYWLEVFLSISASLWVKKL